MSFQISELAEAAGSVTRRDLPVRPVHSSIWKGTDDDTARIGHERSISCHFRLANVRGEPIMVIDSNILRPRKRNLYPANWGSEKLKLCCGNYTKQRDGGCSAIPLMP